MKPNKQSGSITLPRNRDITARILPAPAPRTDQSKNGEPIAVVISPEGGSIGKGIGPLVPESLTIVYSENSDSSIVPLNLILAG